MSRILNSENRLRKVSHIIITAWCLLPLAAALGYAFYTGKMVQYEEAGITLFHSMLSAEQQKAQEANYWCSMARTVYYSLFDLLGFLTIASALFISVFLAASKKNMVSDILKRKPWIILLAAVLAMLAISCLLSDDPALCWIGNDYRHEGLFSYIVYFSVLVCSSFTSADKRKIYIKLIAYEGVMLAVIMLCQYYEVPHFNDITDSLAAVFFNFNHLAYYLTVTVALLACLFIFTGGVIRKILYAAMLLPVVYALILNNTFGCYLASGAFLVICVLYASLYYKHFSLLSLVPLLLFICIFIWVNRFSEDTAAADNLSANFSALTEDVATIAETPEDAGMAGNGRFGLWVEAFGLISEKPITGYGPDSLDPEKYFTYGYGRPHNEFIQYALFAGIPAALCYIAALILIFLRQIKQIDRLPVWTVIAAGGVTAYLISSLFGNTTFYITPYYFILLGMAMDTEKLQDI